MARRDDPGSSSASQAILMELVATSLSLAVLFVGGNMLRKRLDPNYEAKKRLEERKRELAERVARQRLRAGRPPPDLSELTLSEEAVAQYLVEPESLDVRSLDDVGGHEESKQSLRELVILPFRHPAIFAAGSLLQPPRGVLLYGPPGTGKTMMAKALAAESGACFIAISPATLLSKWVGETQQLTRAVFSLAYKLQPCIVFIDEIDALFRTRSAQDHEVYRDFKAEMMQLWDGLTTDVDAQVLVLGATNRPWDVDTAIQRRMPRSFLVDLPDRAQRRKVLQSVLRNDAHRISASLDECAAMTEGYSGSDLKELCRAAALLPLRDAMRGGKLADRWTGGGDGSGSSGSSGIGAMAAGDDVDTAAIQLRSITIADFREAMKSVAPAGWHAESYRLKQADHVAEQRDVMREAHAVMREMLQQQQRQRHRGTRRHRDDDNHEKEGGGGGGGDEDEENGHNDSAGDGSERNGKAAAEQEDDEEEEEDEEFALHDDDDQFGAFVERIGRRLG